MSGSPSRSSSAGQNIPYLTRNSARASTYAATPTTDRSVTPVFATSSTPTATPESPYHLHPPGAPDHVRQPAQAIPPETALSDLSALIATGRAAGRL